MKQRQVAKSMPRMLLTIGMTATMVACGGGSDGNEPVLVGKSVASYDISGVSATQKKALSAAGTEVSSAKCYPGIKPSAGIITEDRIPAVLYVYQVRARDLEAASALGFSVDYSTTGFSQKERACVSDPDTPADDTQPDDIPAKDTPADPT